MADFPEAAPDLALTPPARAQGSLGKSERTRIKLIKTAERLFGDLGIDAVGLRSISEAAHQKNNNVVQYHFGSKLELLKAIMEFREGELQPQRQALLDQGEAQNRLSDVRWLLRVCFEPNYRLYRDHHEISYLKLHASYLSTHRPRGVLHPVDYDSPNSVSYRRAITLIGERLRFLDTQHLWLRLECVGSMFLSAFIQHAARKEELNLPADELFEDMIEMMATAISALPSR